MGAHSGEPMPEGMDGDLDAEVIYDPPNLTFPFGAYICVVDIDPGTAQVKVRRFIAVDDCGTRINPMIIDGQVHGGLTDGVGMALMEIIAFDEEGNCLDGSFMDYLIPTALEVPDWETGYTVTPSPHHPIGAKGIGESATVGSPPAIVNAVVDALTHPRRRPHGHALHPGPRLGRHAGAARAAAVMTPAALAARRRNSRAAGEPFVHATVVRAQRPTSVHAGDIALVLGDGTIEGFVGGDCVEHSVRAYSLRGPGRTGSRSCCASCPREEEAREDVEEGAVDGPEPVPERRGDRGLPRAGRARPAGARGRRDADRRRGHARSAPSSASTSCCSRRASAPRAGDLGLVVASHGREEAGALRRGLRAGVPYVALVASRARGAGVLGELRGDGVADEPSRASTSPPGIDIGARTPAEIALSILARVVEVRRREPEAPPAPAPRAGRRPGRHGRRPDLRHDRRRRGRHAVARARRGDGLLLLRRLPGGLRGAAPACRRRRLSPFVSGAGARRRRLPPPRAPQAAAALRRRHPARPRRRRRAGVPLRPARAWPSAGRRTRCAPRRPDRRRRRGQRRLRRGLLVVDRRRARRRSTRAATSSC